MDKMTESQSNNGLTSARSYKSGHQHNTFR